MAYVTQQLIKTTEGWVAFDALGKPVPKDYWLFERVIDGDNTYYKFKLSDGVHLFAELPYQLLNGNSARISQDGFWETFNDATQQYVKTDVKALGSDGKSAFEVWQSQPGNADKTVEQYLASLRGRDGAISEDAPADGKTYGRKNEGWAEVPTKTSQLQNDDNVVKDAAYVHTDNNYSDEEKQKVADSLRFKDVTEVTTLTDLPVANYSIKATLSAASPISFAETPTEGEEYMIDILNSGSADFDQPLPNADNCQSNETSVTCPAGKVTAISVRYIHGKYVFRV